LGQNGAWRAPAFRGAAERNDFARAPDREGEVKELFSSPLGFLSLCLAALAILLSVGIFIAIALGRRERE